MGCGGVLVAVSLPVGEMLGVLDPPELVLPPAWLVDALEPDEGVVLGEVVPAIDCSGLPSEQPGNVSAATMVIVTAVRVRRAGTISPVLACATRPSMRPSAREMRLGTEDSRAEPR